MKKLSLLFVITSFLSITSFAQPQWKFHVAFEDATGARDTIWLIRDTTATGGILGQYDTLLNEGPFAFDYNSFNVFITNENYDSTKTWAYPYYYPTIQVQVKAFNYEYPITISWDTTLFRSYMLTNTTINNAWLGNDYFYLYNNSAEEQSFNMLIDNSVVAPAFFYGAQSHFPLGILVGANEVSIGNKEIKNDELGITIFPNPCADVVSLKSSVNIKEYYLVSSDGKVVRTNSSSEPQNSIITISVTDLESGLYILKTNNFKNQINYEKIIIIH